MNTTIKCRSRTRNDIPPLPGKFVDRSPDIGSSFTLLSVYERSEARRSQRDQKSPSTARAQTTSRQLSTNYSRSRNDQQRLYSAAGLTNDVRHFYTSYTSGVDIQGE